MFYYKKTIQFLSIFFCVLYYSQLNTKDTLRGDFTYVLKAKLNKLTPDYKYQEFFSLQVSDKRSFFASVQSLKRDSVFQSITAKTVSNGSHFLSAKGLSIPRTNFSYTIIQSSEGIEYFQLIGMAKLSYKEPILSNWKLIDETKIINTIPCKKAEIKFKGRTWIAWYSTTIPFPFGPYKFNGLPGLIVKIADSNEDYDFELVKSLSSKEFNGKFVNIFINRYTDAIETTQLKFERALKDSFDNPVGTIFNTNTTIIQGQEIIRNRQIEREKNRNKENPLELID